MPVVYCEFTLATECALLAETTHRGRQVHGWLSPSLAGRMCKGEDCFRLLIVNNNNNINNVNNNILLVFIIFISEILGNYWSCFSFCQLHVWSPFCAPWIAGKHLLILAGNMSRKILPWFSSRCSFSLKHKGFYHLCVLCAHRKRLYFRYFAYLGKKSVQNITKMLHSLFRLDIKCFQCFHKGIKNHHLKIWKLKQKQLAKSACRYRWFHVESLPLWSIYGARNIFKDQKIFSKCSHAPFT